LLQEARRETEAGRFWEAIEKLERALALAPREPLRQRLARLRIVAGLYPELKGSAHEVSQAVLHRGLADFLDGRDREALRTIECARDFRPEDPRLEALREAIQRGGGLSLKPRAAARLLRRSLALLEAAFRERQYDKVEGLAVRVIGLDPENSLAFQRMGAAYYAQGKYPEALQPLRSAFRYERDPGTRKKLASYLEALGSLIEKAGVESQERLDGLYESAVELYAQGRLREAAGLFSRILESDPSNARARRGLERVGAELLRAGRKK